MKLSLLHLNNELHFDLSRPMNISIPIQRNGSVSSFQIDGAVYVDYQDGDFIGNKNKGGACNLETVTFTAHGNGSHTECVGHISNEKYFVNDCISDSFYLSQLHTANCKENEDGLFVDLSSFLDSSEPGIQALVLRTLPNPTSKKHKDYSSSPTPCIAPDDMQKIVDLGIKHLLIDLPSVDPEWDGGKLLSHHIFWNYPKNPRLDASISEFIYINEEIEDGIYALKLNIGNFISDASPSTPTLYPIF
ncbi:MAG: cyclase family protein [Bacteroidia bacterium]